MYFKQGNTSKTNNKKHDFMKIMLFLLPKHQIMQYRKTSLI
jgi:hypothetical protein